MPELPEVETTRRGIEPHLVGRRVERIVLQRADLRWPIPSAIHRLEGQLVRAVSRRAKYLLAHTDAGDALLHLGMSGSLRVVTADTPRKPHDHVDWLLSGGAVLRLHDPRRFGCLLFQAPGTVHELLRRLGPEPLSESFSGETLFAATRRRTSAIKPLLMNPRVVVGVGNIYAAEALFAAGVRPQRRAEKVTRAECARIAREVKGTLQRSIDRGGTTLRDFVSADGAPGYFQQELLVYGREGAPCRVCETPIRSAALGARQSCYCPRCQR